MKILTVTSGTLTQKLFDKVGEGQPYQSLFLKKGEYLAVSPYKLNDGTILSGESGAVIKLMKHADPQVFKSMVPVLGQKNSSIKNIVLENISFLGDKDNQDVPHGKGFHNFAWFQNASNVTFRNVTVQDTQGDGLRIKNGDGVYYYKNNVIRCGHDGLYVDGGRNVEAWGNYTELRTNSAIRLRHVHGGHIHHNTVINKVKGAASSPGFQIEVSDVKQTGSNIRIESNSIVGTYGPGIWAICTKNGARTAAAGLTIQNNFFQDCGNMTHISGVGGVVCDGWTDVKIWDNTFENCKGYGVLFGKYIESLLSAGSGYTADVRYNVIINTKKSATAGTGSGAGVANLLTGKYTVTAGENYHFNNVLNYYNVTGTGDIIPGQPPELPPMPGTDPEEPGPGEEPGEERKKTLVFITCKESQVSEIQNLITDPVYRRD